MLVHQFHVDLKFIKKARKTLVFNRLQIGGFWLWEYLPIIFFYACKDLNLSLFQ